MSTAIVLAGLAAVGTGVAGMVEAHAAAVGSNFGSIDVSVAASGVRVPMYSTGGEDVEAQVPWSTVSMQTGGVTHALTSVFWPGDTGGAGGDTLYLLGVPCILSNPQGVLPVDPPCVYQPQQPPQSVYQALNDPYKAEAQSGSGSPIVTGGGQGVSMRAVAHSTDASALTTISGSQLPVGGDTFGATSTVTTVKATGPNTAVVDATSVVHDVSLGGGAITIKSITSVAHAVTDTVHATGSAVTTVSGMRIAGQPATVDSSGVHIGPQNSPLPATDALNAALKQSGFQIYVAKPTKVAKGGAISLDSGNLVLMQTNSQYNAQANDTQRLVVLGGATIQAAAGKGFQLPSLTPPPLGVTAPPAQSGSAGTPGTPGTPGTTGSVGTPTGNAPVVASPNLAAKSFTLPGGISPAWVVLVLLGAGLFAAGMRRLPDSVLEATGAACPLEEGLR